MIDDIEDAITLSMQEGSMKAELETQEQHLKWAWDMIENRGKKQTGKQAKKQASKEQQDLAMKQAMMNWNE